MLFHLHLNTGMRTSQKNEYAPHRKAIILNLEHDWWAVGRPMESEEIYSYQV